MMLGATDIRESIHAVARVEDWSGCRSPSRARRRLKRGFPQRMRVMEKPCAYQIGGTIVMHPIVYAEFKRELAKRSDVLNAEGFYHEPR